jgi:OmpA-OmpF porin, OOP family
MGAVPTWEEKRLNTVSTLVAGTLALAAVPALAQSHTNHLYAGASIGQSYVKEWCEGAPAGVNCDDNDTAWKVFGGYQFHPNFAVELGYTDLGSASLSSGTVRGTVESSAFELVGVGSFPVGGRLALYGKLGFYRGEISGRVTAGSSTRFADSDEGTEITFGLGARIDFNHNFAARLEWQKYNDFSGSDIDVLSVGLLYRFR